jgi:hypothetical protein
MHIHTWQYGAKLLSPDQTLDAVLSHAAVGKLRSVNYASLAPGQLEPFHRRSLADSGIPGLSLSTGPERATLSGLRPENVARSGWG